MLLLPGTSGNVSSEYGIEQSLGPIASVVQKMGYSPVAFQPSIYFNAGGTPEERAPILKRYGNLEGNLEWFAQILAFSQARVELSSLPAQPLYGILRCTFAAIGLEALHRSLQGETRFDFLRRFSSLGAFGLLGHTPEAIEKWSAAEEVYYLERFKEKGDPLDVKAAPAIFREMTHQTQKIKGVTGPLPKIIPTVGARDEFVNGELTPLIWPVLNFGRNHPDISTTLIFHDGFHNPSVEIRELRVSTMERMRPILDKLFEPAELKDRGMDLLFHPSKKEVLRPLPQVRVQQCVELLNENGLKASRSFQKRGGTQDIGIGN